MLHEALLPFSGPQLIVRDALAYALEDEERTGQTCRICGGPITGKNFSSQMSNSWTNENLCANKSSAFICPSCKWLTTRTNRMNGVWDKSRVIVALPSKRLSLGYHELLDVLRSDFDTPAVFMLQGDDVKANFQKHQQWKSIRAVTYDRHNVHVVMSNFRTSNKASKFDAIADFDADEFVPFVEGLMRTTEDYIVPRLKKPSGILTFLYLLRGYNDLEFSEISPEILLASYLAAYTLFPSIPKEKRVV